jgi:hypothetical protein
MAIEKFTGTFTKEDGGCTIQINETIQCIRHGDACALYSYLSTLPNTWELNIKHLMSHFFWGENKTYKALKFLIKIGLIVKIDHRDKGKFIKHEYILKLRPNLPLDEINQMVGTLMQPTSSPLDDFSRVENSHVTNHHTYKTNNSIKQKEIENKEDNNRYLSSISPSDYPETYYPLPNDKTKTLNPLQLLQNNPHGIPAQMIQDWFVNRKAKRAPVTKTVWDRLNKELSKCSNPLDAFEMMVASGWQSFKAEWINTQNKNASHFDNSSTQYGNNYVEDIL